MSVESQQVTKDVTAKRAQAAPAVINRARGFAGNHTLMRKQRANRIFGRQAHETTQSLVRRENKEQSLQRNASQESAPLTVPPIVHEVLHSGTSPSFTSARRSLLQRKCACGGSPGLTDECAECSSKGLAVQRRAAEKAGPISVPPIVHEVLRSPGQPLDPATRAFMEPRFGHDFSQVRVHTDARAAESARAVNASAYTVGREVVFGSGRYAPATTEGRSLIAHELTHTVQQSSGASQATLTIGDPVDAHEREADALAARVAAGATVGASRANDRPSVATLQRQADGAGDGRAGCAIGAGIPNSNCSAYIDNWWWLPLAYVNNATCACKETPNVPTAKCVRKFLQDRLAATPRWLKVLAAAKKPFEVLDPAAYFLFVQSFLRPRIEGDHVDAYAACCCPSGPAGLPAWIGVTTVPLPCAAVGESIREFGSCHGTPGAW